MQYLAIEQSVRNRNWGHGVMPGAGVLACIDIARPQFSELSCDKGALLLTCP